MIWAISHASSLGQGGKIPNNSTAWRTAGRIFSQNSNIQVELYPSDNAQDLTLALFDGAIQVSSVSGTGNLTLNYTPTATNYYTIQVKNSNSANPAQHAWVKATYTAPQVVNASAYKHDGKSAANTAYLQQELATSALVNPVTGEAQIHVSGVENGQLEVFDTMGRLVLSASQGQQQSGEITFRVQLPGSGVYLYRVTNEQGSASGKLVRP